MKKPAPAGLGALASRQRVLLKFTLGRLFKKQETT
jgi:hypothetical protein